MSLFHDVMFTGRILCNSYTRSHSYGELLSTITMQDSISQHLPWALMFFLHTLLQYAMSLGEGDTYVLFEPEHSNSHLLSAL